MRISYAQRFILLHIPRTGVSSLIAALDPDLFYRAKPSALNKLLSKYLWMLPRSQARTSFRTHETINHVRRLLPSDEFESFRKIAFVRNPFSWLVSQYELVVQSPNHRHYPQVSKLNGFSDYIDWEITRGKRFQTPYLFDTNDRLLVDRVGCFENLVDDAKTIFAAIDVELKALPTVGKFTRRDYREFYDSGSKHKVETHWMRDLELLGYDFDGITGTGALTGHQPDSDRPASDRACRRWLRTSQPERTPDFQSGSHRLPSHRQESGRS